MAKLFWVTIELIPEIGRCTMRSAHMAVMAWSPNGRVRSGETVDGLCQLFDLGPTILELAGCEVPRQAWSRTCTLLPALQGPTLDAAQSCVLRAGWRRQEPRPAASSSPAFEVTAGSWFSFKGSTEGQLFDMVADPGEVTDLWSSPEHVDVKREMLDVIRDWLI